MALKLLFFATAAGWVKQSRMDIEFTGPQTVAELLAERKELMPLRSRLKSVKIAVNSEFVSAATRLQDEDEIAFLPPVSGG